MAYKTSAEGEGIDGRGERWISSMDQVIEVAGYSSLEGVDKCNFYMIFIILLFIKIVCFSLFILIWFDFYLYLSINLCFEGMRRFQINLQGLYMQSGAGPIESSQLTSSKAWIQEKSNLIKFKSNWSKESKEICTKSKSNSD